MKFLICGAFSTHHSHPSWAQIFVSGTCFQIPLAWIPPLMYFIVGLPFKILKASLSSILLLNIMLHAPMVRFQLELIYYLTYFTCLLETEETSKPTRPVENVVLTTKGLQEETHNCLMGRRWKNR